MDVENLPSGYNATGVSQRYITAQESQQNRMENNAAEKDSDQLETMDTANDEIGTPQNVSNDDLGAGNNSSGADRSNDDDVHPGLGAVNS